MKLLPPPCAVLLVIQVIIQIIACTSSTLSTYIVSRCSSDHTLPLPKFRSTNLQTRKWQFDVICFHIFQQSMTSLKECFKAIEHRLFKVIKGAFQPGTNHPNRTRDKICRILSVSPVWVYADTCRLQASLYIERFKEIRKAAGTYSHILDSGYDRHTFYSCES